MAKKPASVPSDEEIMSYANVPYPLAAKYIGWSDITVRYALQEERCPFGCAAQNPKTGTWSYNISPGLLVKYKRGELPVTKFNDLVAMLADQIDRVVNIRLETARAALM